MAGGRGMMHLAADYVHPTSHGGRCRVRIFLPDDPRDTAVVICTEPRGNPGQSVTNAAERIAGEVISAYRLPVPLVWIEHYEDSARETREDPASFDLITFAHYEPRQVLGVDVAKPGSKKIGPPSWKALDRATVEALVGGPV